MLHGTIRNDDFHSSTMLQCWNNVVTSIRNNVATLCCAKNRHCELSNNDGDGYENVTFTLKSEFALPQI